MRWLMAVLGVVLLVGGLFWFGQRSMMYFPDTTAAGSAADRFPNGSDVTFTTRDGVDLGAWLLAPTGADREMAVLYLPGNGGNRVGRAEVGQALAAEGFTVLLVDYRGYGGNPGHPSENGLVADAEAAAAYLTQQGFPPERTIYVGESVGTGVAGHLAAADPPAGVLLRSPYTSFPDMARAAYKIPFGWAIRDTFDTLSRMPQITSPVTVLYGADDGIVPPEQSRQVADAAPNLHDVVALPGTGHNDSVWFGAFLAEQVAALADGR